MSPTLPEGFEDLAPWAAQWAVPSERERYARRVGSTLPELEAFYQAVQPRLQAALDHLNTYPNDFAAVPEPQRRLAYLVMALMEISRAVEVWRAPDVHATHFRAHRVHIGQ
jgi:hypothetical protein